MVILNYYTTKKQLCHLFLQKKAPAIAGALLRYRGKNRDKIPYYKVNDEYSYYRSPEKPFSRQEFYIPAEKSSEIFKVKKYQKQAQKRHSGIIPYCGEYMPVEQRLHTSRISAARTPVSCQPVKWTFGEKSFQAYYIISEQQYDRSKDRCACRNKNPQALRHILPWWKAQPDWAERCCFHTYYPLFQYLPKGILMWLL